MTTSVFTVESSEFTIDGTPYDVTSVALSAVLNAIPVCQVGIYVPSSGSDGSPNVNTLSLHNLSKNYQDLQQKAIALTTCNLKIKLKNSEANSNLNTTLELQNWLLTFVGLSPVSTTSGFYVNCTIAHPAYRLSLCLGAIFSSTGVLDFNDKIKACEDPIEASKAAIDLCIKANSGQPEQHLPTTKPVTNSTLKTLEAMHKQVSTSLDQIKTDVGKLLTWDTTYSKAEVSIPGERLLTQNLSDGVRYALLTTWTYAMFNQSYWDILVGLIAPEFGLEIIPTYNQPKLIVGPAFPWKNEDKAKIDLSESLCSSIAFPGKDPDPIFGYVAQSDSEVPAGGCITVPGSATQKTATMPSQYPFIPAGITSSVGRIRKVNTPYWLDTAREYASKSKHSKGTITTGDSYKSEQAKPQQTGGGDAKTILEDVATGIMMHLSNLFTLEYKSGVQAVLRCPFFTGIGEKTLYPGMRIKLSTDKGEPLFIGSIATIVHEIVCPSSYASTTINLSHCVFSDADAKVLGKPPFAPYYKAQGTVTW